MDMGRAARIANIAIAVWLFISAFVWRHTMVQRTDTWIVAVLMALAAAAALANPLLRYANTALSVWLCFFTLITPRGRPGMFWNNVVIAIVVFILSLVPSRPVHPAVGEPARP